MSLIELFAYKVCRYGLFCNSSVYARARAHMNLVDLSVRWDVCVSVGWRSLGCGSLSI
jgi:hypothetical protein